jgi:hypothetical protein
MSVHPALFTRRRAAGAYLMAHDGETVTVEAVHYAGQPDRDLQASFWVRFADGEEATVYRDELLCLHDGEEDASDCPLVPS